MLLLLVGFLPLLAVLLLPPDITRDKCDPQTKPTWTGITTADVLYYDYYIYCSVRLGILRRKELSKRITFIE